MSKRHLKAIASPRSWPIRRKQQTFVIRPNPGAHKIDESMPIGLILKLFAQIKTTREAKHIINQRKVLVNKKPVKDIKFPAGLFDVIEFSDKQYRILFNKRGKLSSKEINKSEADLFLYKIKNKTKLKKGKMQLNFHNGFNMIVDKNDYKTNDVLLIENKQIKEKIPFEKNSLVYITKGNNLGQVAKVDTIHEKFPLSKMVTVTIKDKKMLLPKDYVFTIGKTKPIVTVQ